jgi:DNA modification methylase
MNIDLRLGDCMEVMRSIADGSVDSVITDPPYGIDYQSVWRIDSERMDKIANDKEPFVSWCVDAFRVMKSIGGILCFCRWDVQEDFRRALDVAGFSIKSQVIWDRMIHGLGDLNAQFAPQHDVIWWATKGDYAFPGKRPKSVIQYQRVSPDKLVHPNEKPEMLINALIRITTKPGDSILDPFMGSGTTGVACARTGRNFVGIEIDERYFRIAEKRIRDSQMQQELDFN